MPAPYDQEETFWDYFQDKWWMEENILEDTYEGLTNRQHKLLNAAYLVPRADAGGSYPCEEEDLVVVARIPTPRPPMEEVTVRLAAGEICHYNSTPRRLSSTERQMISDLDKYLFNRVSLRAEDLPSLVIKAFKDLDTILFGSYLFGRVHVRWAGTRSMNWDYAGRVDSDLQGLTTGKRWGSRIDLCIDGLLLAPGGAPLRSIMEGVLVTLVHEMVHAYFQVRCPYRDISAGHDNAFWCALEAVAIHIEEEFGFSAARDHFDHSYSQ